MSIIIGAQGYDNNVTQNIYLENTRQFVSVDQLSILKVGMRCWTEIGYSIRFENSRREEHLDITYEPPYGFVIIQAVDLQECRIGNTNGPHSQIIENGKKLRITGSARCQLDNFGFYKTGATLRGKFRITLIKNN